ncbi:MAG: mechanosensitive ion channel domain-containing protein [Acidaminobacteraceae bacterium]
MEELYNRLEDISFNKEVLYTVILFIILGVFRKLILKLLHYYVEDVQVFHRYKKVTNRFSFVLSVIFIFLIWSNSVYSVGTYFGLLSAGIAIALKDLLTSVAAWLFIVTRRPFSIGDRVEVGKVAGDVVDIRIFQFTIMEIGNWVHADQSTGRIIHIPNHKLLTENLANYSAGFEYIWNEIEVVITFESDWKKAKSAFESIIEEHSKLHNNELEKKLRIATKKYLIHYNNMTPIIYTDVVEHGVKLSIRYLCMPRSRRTTVDKIWRDILKTIDECDDITLAYPTQRVILE